MIEKSFNSGSYLKGILLLNLEIKGVFIQASGIDKYFRPRTQYDQRHADMGEDNQIQGNVRTSDWGNTGVKVKIKN